MMHDVEVEHTKVLCAFIYHPAIHLPQSIAGVDDLKGIRDNLIVAIGGDILSGVEYQYFRMRIPVKEGQGRGRAATVDPGRLTL